MLKNISSKRDRDRLRRKAKRQKRKHHRQLAASCHENTSHENHADDPIVVVMNEFTKAIENLETTPNAENALKASSFAKDVLRIVPERLLPKRWILLKQNLLDVHSKAPAVVSATSSTVAAAGSSSSGEKRIYSPTNPEDLLLCHKENTLWQWKPKLIILDLNGLLLYRKRYIDYAETLSSSLKNRNKHHYRYGYNNSMPRSVESRNTPQFPRPDHVLKKNGRKSHVVWIRRDAKQFISWLRMNFAVGIWSSANKDNINQLLSILIPKQKERDALAFVLDQTYCTRVHGGIQVANSSKTKPKFLKNLGDIWRRHELVSGIYTAANTLLVDDSPYKSVNNPIGTCLHPPEWTSEIDQHRCPTPKPIRNNFHDSVPNAASYYSTAVAVAGAHSLHGSFNHNSSHYSNKNEMDIRRRMNHDNLLGNVVRSDAVAPDSIFSSTTSSRQNVVETTTTYDTKRCTIVTSDVKGSGSKRDDDFLCKNGCLNQYLQRLMYHKSIPEFVKNNILST